MLDGICLSPSDLLHLLRSPLSPPGDSKVHPRLRITDRLYPSHSVAQGNPVLKTGIKAVLLIRGLWALSFHRSGSFLLPEVGVSPSLIAQAYLSDSNATSILPAKFFPSSNTKPQHPSFLPSSCNMCYLYMSQK